MRVLLAPDKFKGSLSAADVAAHVSAGLRSVIADLDVMPMPVADGGDGTVDAAVAAGFDRIAITACGPTGEPVETSYARRGDDPVVEMASICGLARLPGGVLAPMTASSYGLGEVVRAATQAGARRVVLGIGGSASTDGGAGFLQGVGVRVRGRDHGPLARGGGALADVQAIDVGVLRAELADAELVVASDVDNPLTGPNGAAAVYGPQKGATPEQVPELDKALRRWAHVVAQAVGTDQSDIPGAGAAGGVGFAAAAVLGASLRPGIELMLELAGLHSVLATVDLVITGEGSLDEQSLAGKAPIGVASAARAEGVPVVAVCGRNVLSEEVLHRAGITAAYALLDLESDVVHCVAEPGPLLERLGAIVAKTHLVSQ